MNRKALPLGLIVMDGWGEAPPSQWNAVRGSNPEHLDALKGVYPSTLLLTSGEAVGLPPGQIGNSEVGHLCMGAGRNVLTDLDRINRAISTGSFTSNGVLCEAIDAARSGSGVLHLMGLFSNGGVHSHIDHLRALIGLARARGIQRIFVHAFLDGRDTPPKSAIRFMTEFEHEHPPSGPVRIATVCGRYYAMDRDNRWERVEIAYRALVRAEGFRARNGTEAIEAAYARGETDEFVKPTVIVEGNGTATRAIESLGAVGDSRPIAQTRPIGSMGDGGSVLFFNFRADRARELTRALTFEAFDRFERGPKPALARYTCFALYDRTFNLPVAFTNEPPLRILGELLAESGLRQLRIAETEKYAHVTFFFNGGREAPFEREDRFLVPSPKVATYDLQPEMSAPEITSSLLDRLRAGSVDFFLLNFANADMVGHTGIYEAAVKACKEVDRSVGAIVKEVLAQGGAVLVTADHGNSEQMWDFETDSPHTAHTTNPVPCIFASDLLKGRALRGGGVLADVAPTLLALLELDQPSAMTGRSLLL